MYEVICNGGQVYRFQTPQELKAFVLKFYGKKILVGQSFRDNFGLLVETRMSKSQGFVTKTYESKLVFA